MHNATNFVKLIVNFITEFLSIHFRFFRRHFNFGLFIQGRSIVGCSSSVTKIHSQNCFDMLKLKNDWIHFIFHKNLYFIRMIFCSYFSLNFLFKQDNWISNISLITEFPSIHLNILSRNFLHFIINEQLSMGPRFIRKWRIATHYLSQIIWRY